MSFAEQCPKRVVTKVLSGDQVAFGKIYQMYKSAVYSLAYRMLQDQDAAADILQQVFLKMLQKLDGLRDYSKLGSWLKTTTYHLVIDYIRANERLVELDEQQPGSSMTGEKLTSAMSFAELDLQKYLTTLSQRERALVVLIAVEGYTHLEASNMLDISESNSKQIYRRALAKLSSLADLERYSGQKVTGYE